MLTVLLATANSRANPVDLEYEHRRIALATRESSPHDAVVIDPLPAATFEDLEEALVSKKYDVIHFSGHGGQYGGLYFRDEAGNDTVVSPARLASLLDGRSDVRCVVLNACFSLRGGYLISLNVPFTVASEDELLDPVAFAFSRGFYRGLARGQEVPAAYNEAVTCCISEEFLVTRLPVLLRHGHPEAVAIQRLLIPLSDGNVYYPEEIESEGYCKCEMPCCVGLQKKAYCFFPRHLSAWVRRKGLYAPCYDQLIACPRCSLSHKRGHTGRKGVCKVPFTNQRLQRG